MVKLKCIDFRCKYRIQIIQFTNVDVFLVFVRFNIEHCRKREKHFLKLSNSYFQNQLEQEKDEKVRKLEAQYENSLKSIGQGHKEAGEQVSYR